MKIERLVTVTRDVGMIVIGLAGSVWLLYRDSTNPLAYVLCAALLGLPAGLNAIALRPGTGGDPAAEPTPVLSSPSPPASPPVQLERQSPRSSTRSRRGSRGRYTPEA